MYKTKQTNKQTKKVTLVGVRWLTLNPLASVTVIPTKSTGRHLAPADGSPEAFTMELPQGSGHLWEPGLESKLELQPEPRPLGGKAYKPRQRGYRHASLAWVGNAGKLTELVADTFGFLSSNPWLYEGADGLSTCTYGPSILCLYFFQALLELLGETFLRNLGATPLRDSQPCS